jgi:hypothetical protein
VKTEVLASRFQFCSRVGDNGHAPSEKGWGGCGSSTDMHSFGEFNAEPKAEPIYVGSFKLKVLYPRGGIVHKNFKSRASKAVQALGIRTRYNAIPPSHRLVLQPPLSTHSLSKLQQCCFLFLFLFLYFSILSTHKSLCQRPLIPPLLPVLFPLLQFPRLFKLPHRP